MESTRAQKIARQIQKDLGDMFLREAAPLLRGAMVTVMSVRVSPDMGYAKIYLSVFPFDRHAEVMASLEANNGFIRRTLGAKLRNQLRIIPELSFFLDDSFEYIDRIDNLLK
jgi:ribosome-binding factor A